MFPNKEKGPEEQESVIRKFQDMCKLRAHMKIQKVQAKGGHNLVSGYV